MAALVTLSLASGVGTPGGTITLNLSIASTGGAAVSTIQWKFGLTANVLGITSAVIGAAGSGASKTLSIDGSTLLVYGVNQNIIGDGILATVTFRLASVITAADIQVLNTIAADADGLGVLSAGASGRVTPPTPPILACPLINAGTVGTPFSQSLIASGTAPLTFAIPGGLPPGLTLNALSGTISGIPTTAGSFGFTATVTDGLGLMATIACTITIAAVVVPPTPTLSCPAAGSAATAGIAYSHALNPSGGTPGYTFAITGGGLPTGLSLNTSTGLISGTPTTLGVYLYTARVTDSLLQTADVSCSITVAAGAPPMPALGCPAGGSAATLGVAYSYSLDAAGGTAPYTFAIVSGALPTGLSLNASTGLISGTPTAPGNFVYGARVTDALAQTATVTCAILVPTPPPPPPPADPAVLIQAVAAPATGGLSISMTLAAVQAGDLIVAGGCAFFNNGPVAPVVWTASDTQGNTYLGNVFASGPSFGQVVAFYAYAKASGAVTITLTETVSQGHRAVAAHYRNAGRFDQCSVQIGQYTTSNPIAYPIGNSTGAVTLSDTLITTFLYCQSTTCVSDSGSSLAIKDSPGFMYLFNRTVSGPGTTVEKIKTPDSGDNGICPLVTLTFSKTLTRPAGTLAQYALRPGTGFDGSYPFGVAFPVNYPLTASLPYAPQLGSLVVVGCAYNSGSAATFAVTDNYGNTYTQAVRSPGYAGSSIVTLFYSVVRNLPPAGQVFQVQFFGSAPLGSGTYQSTTLAITERIVPAAPTGFWAAAWLSAIDATPSVTLISAAIPNVPNGAYLFAMAAYAGTVTQNTASWAALESYAIERQWNMIQYASQVVNRGRFGVAAIMDKFATASGSYDAQAVATIDANYGPAGSIALLAVSIPASNPCADVSTLTPIAAATTFAGDAPPSIPGQTESIRSNL